MRMQICVQTIHYTSGEPPLHELRDSVYGVVHHVKYIAGESAVLICSTEEDKCLKFPSFKSSYNYLEVGKKVRHLGLVITEQMTDDDDIYGQRRKMYAQAINTLSR